MFGSQLQWYPSPFWYNRLVPKKQVLAVLVIGRRLDWRSRRLISIVNLENKKSIAKNVENVERAYKLC
jgi:hypothetical protein|nr:MAG TPA: hypothetical protein [Caudoviricetes sp.]DAR00282.1 MAG TPA: hypothetical protein [Caudoviricetes sp.]